MREPETSGVERPSGAQQHAVEKEQEIETGRGQPAELPDLGVIETAVSATIPPGRAPVEFEGAPLLRINADSELPSVFALSTEPGAETQYAELSRISRAYEAEAAEVEFFVDAFAYRDGAFALRHSVSLGQAKAIGTFRAFGLGDQTENPLVIALEVYSTTGTQVRWAIFSPGTQPVRFDLEDSGRVTARLEDVDHDGVLEVIKTRREAEAGVGFETYLELYEWDGESMVQAEVTTVVRALNRFLSRAAVHLSNERWQAFIDHATDTSLRERFAAAGLTETEVVRALLRVSDAPADSQYGFLSAGREIDEVFNPQILESPFQQSDRFRHDIRIVMRDGSSYIVSVTVAISPNPFTEPVFTLRPWE